MEETPQEIPEAEIKQKIYTPDDNQITFFGQANFRNSPHRFGIKRSDRRRHMYVIGKTGMGKSTMLENMIIQDIQNGEGVAVVDPHGDLVEKVINYVPPDRIDDVVYINPADIDNPVAFNILENVGLEYRNLVSNGLVGVFKKIWADSWGPRLEYILINTILALLEYPGSTLLGVMRMLVDTKYRRKVVKKITDPVVRSFWVNEFNNYSEKFRNEAIAPIQNKIGQFLSSALIRNIVGQVSSTINMRQLMDEGKIIMLNLSKGRIGEENSALLGAMIITKIQLAAMSRVDIPEEQRRDFYLYVDEFQNFSTDSFAGILSEARKYRLNITMAHQYIEQLSDEVRAAVFGNVGTTVAFRVGAMDAEELEKEFMPTFTQEDIVMLPAYHIYLRLMIDGVASSPFSATTLSPISQPFYTADQVIQRSREKYANNRQEVEEEILRWTGDEDNMPPALKKLDQDKMKEKEDTEKSDVIATAPVVPVPQPPTPPQSAVQQKPKPEVGSSKDTEEDLNDFRKKRLSFVSSSDAEKQQAEPRRVNPPRRKEEPRRNNQSRSARPDSASHKTQSSASDTPRSANISRTTSNNAMAYTQPADVQEEQRKRRRKRKRSSGGSVTQGVATANTSDTQIKNTTTTVAPRTRQPERRDDRTKEKSVSAVSAPAMQEKSTQKKDVSSELSFVAKATTATTSSSDPVQKPLTTPAATVSAQPKKEPEKKAQKPAQPQPLQPGKPIRFDE